MSLGSIAVIGGGINGLCIATELENKGWKIKLYERGNCLDQTSRASTKLLHGGLRYIDQGHFLLVAESLYERARWLHDAPQQCGWLTILLPVIKGSKRHSWQRRFGLGIYDG